MVQLDILVPYQFSGRITRCISLVPVNVNGKKKKQTCIQLPGVEWSCWLCNWCRASDLCHAVVIAFHITAVCTWEDLRRLSMSFRNCRRLFIYSVFCSQWFGVDGVEVSRLAYGSGMLKTKMPSTISNKLFYCCTYLAVLPTKCSFWSFWYQLFLVLSHMISFFLWYDAPNNHI